MKNPKLFYIGVKGLIKNSQGQYLLLKANMENSEVEVDPYWDIPGGRIEGTEDALTALRREIFEETQIQEITNIEFVIVTLSKLVEAIDIPGLALFIYNVTIPDAAKIVIDPQEHTEYAWFDAVDAARLLSSKYATEFTSTIA